MPPITVDVVGVATSVPIPLDFNVNPFNVSIFLSVVSGDIVATLEYTGDDVFAEGYTPIAGTWFAHADLTAKTTDAFARITDAVTAVRIVNTGTGTVGVRILQGWASYPKPTNRATIEASAIGVDPVIVTLGVIAMTRGQIPTATANITQNFTSLRTHWSSSQGAITNLKSVDLNWYISNGFAPTASATALTFKRYIEYPPATFHQVTWGGSPNLVFTAGVAELAKSDTWISSITGLPLVIAPNTKVAVRTVKISAGSQGVACVELPAGSTVLGIDDGNSASDLGNSGTVPATTGITTFGPAWIEGDIAVANAKSYALIGDSIPFGQGDITAADSKFNCGWLARSVGVSYPYLKLAKASWSASDLAGSASAAFTALFAAIPVTDAIYEHGVNDLRLGRTKAQLLADQQTNYARLGSGVRKHQTTITARSDSGNAYADVPGQTPKTDGNMAALTSTNTDIRAIPANLTGIVDAADFGMSARDSNVWGGPFPPTLDGTHPTTAKAAAMAALYVP